MLLNRLTCFQYVVSVMHVLCADVLCVLYVVQFDRLEFAADLGGVSSIVFEFRTGIVLWCC